MEWYWIVLMLAALAGIVSLLYILRKKGYISHDIFTVLKAGVQFAKSLLSKKEDTSSQVISYILRLVDAAILMSEQLWCDGEIDYENRYEKCKDILADLLKESGIQLPEDVQGAMTALIQAAQNVKGHETYDEYAVAVIMEADDELAV